MVISIWKNDDPPRDRLILVNDGETIFIAKYIEDPHMPHEMEGYFVEVSSMGILRMYEPVKFSKWCDLSTLV